MKPLMVLLLVTISLNCHAQTNNLRHDAFAIIESFLMQNDVLLTSQEFENASGKEQKADEAMRTKYKELLDPSGDFFPNTSYTHRLLAVDLAFLGGEIFLGPSFTPPPNGFIPRLRIIANNKQIVGVGSSKYRLYFSLNELASFAASADVQGKVATFVQYQFKSAFTKNFEKALRFNLASGTFENRFAAIIRKPVETMSPYEFLPLYYLWTELSSQAAPFDSPNSNNYILGDFTGVIIETASNNEYNGHIEASADVRASFARVPFVNADLDAQAKYDKYSTTRNEYANTNILITGQPNMVKLPGPGDIKKRWDYLSSNISRPIDKFITPYGENTVEVEFGPISSRDQLENIHLIKDGFLRNQTPSNRIVSDIVIKNKELSGTKAIITLAFTANDDFFRTSNENETTYGNQISLALGRAIGSDSLLTKYPVKVRTNGIIMPDAIEIALDEASSGTYEWSFSLEFKNVPVNVTLEGGDILSSRVVFTHSNSASLANHLTVAKCMETADDTKFDCKITLSDIANLLSPTDFYLPCELELKLNARVGTGHRETTRKYALKLTGISPSASHLPLNGVTYVEHAADIARILKDNIVVGSITYDSLKKQQTSANVPKDSIKYFTALGDIIINEHRLSREPSTHRFIVENALIDRSKIKELAMKMETDM